MSNWISEHFWEFEGCITPILATIITAVVVIIVISVWMAIFTVSEYNGIGEGDIVKIDSTNITGKVRHYNKLLETYKVRFVDPKGVVRYDGYEVDEITLVKKYKAEKPK